MERKEMREGRERVGELKREGAKGRKRGERRKRKRRYMVGELNPHLPL